MRSTRKQIIGEDRLQGRAEVCVDKKIENVPRQFEFEKIKAQIQNKNRAQSKHDRVWMEQ